MIKFNLNNIDYVVVYREDADHDWQFVAGCASLFAAEGLADMLFANLDKDLGGGWYITPADKHNYVRILPASQEAFTIDFVGRIVCDLKD